MRLFFPDTPDLPLPAEHRFPRGKYQLLRVKLQADGIVAAHDLAPSPAAGLDEIACAHDPGYIDAVMRGALPPDAQRRIGLPWSEVLALRARVVVGGALAAAREALASGASGQLAGGTHHAHRDFGSGFCVFNDLAVTALTLLRQGDVSRVAIVDLDVHQGDGNAAILAGSPGVLVASVHGERNFPFRKAVSDIDVGLPDGTGDDAYLAALAPVLEQVAAFRPEIVLYLSGADPLASDKLGRLSLTYAGLIARDRMVFEMARRLAAPVSIAIGGGYADPIDDTVEAYANTFRAARSVLRV
jgi:acetoin utilization deacetylase AcuC-like enzyme